MTKHELPVAEKNHDVVTMSISCADAREQASGNQRLVVTIHVVKK